MRHTDFRPHPQIVERYLTVLGLALCLFIAAGAHPRSAAMRPISEWLVVGPFPVDTGATRVTRAYLPGESTLLPAPGETAGGHTWTVVAADSIGQVDLNAHLPAPTENAAAYAAVYITSPADRTVLLGVESDDDVMAWLGDRLVLHHEVARGIGSGVDTVVIRLAKGVNRLLYKVVNRSGGFGLGGQLLTASPDPIAGLSFSATPPANVALVRPAPTVTLGPGSIGDHAVLTAGRRAHLEIAVDVAVLRWGGLVAPVAMTVAGQSVTLPPDSESGAFDARVPWPDLAGPAREGRLTLHARYRGNAPGAVVPPPFYLPDARDRILTTLSRPILLEGWQATRDAAGTSAPTGAWLPLPSHPITTAADSTLTALRVESRVPATLAGLTLRMDAAELSHGPTIRLNGSVVTPDSMGQFVVCAPCREGAPLDVAIDLHGNRWWDPPRLMVADAGWAEIRDGAHWARQLAGDSAIEPPDDNVASTLLADAVRPDKARYHDVIQQWLDRIVPAAAAVRADTIALVGNSHIDAAWLWRWRETVGVVEHTWGTAVKLLEKYPQMHFAASAARYYTWLEEDDPALLHDIQAMVKRGRWDPVGGWWVESDANLPSGESLVRQGLYGQRTYERLFGHIATVGWLPDSFGYNWQLPQIMLGQGLRAFVTQKVRWGNDTDKWPSRLNLFWWQGRDGSRILTYIPYNYDDGLDADGLARHWRATRDSSAVDQLYVLYGVGDHGGGPTMRMLERRRDLQRVPSFPALRDVSPATILARMADSLAALPPVATPYPGGGIPTGQMAPAGASGTGDGGLGGGPAGTVPLAGAAIVDIPRRDPGARVAAPNQPARGAAVTRGAPVVDDELYLEYHRGVYTSHAAMKAWNRKMEGLLGAAEAAATAAGEPAGAASAQATRSATAYPHKELADAWHLVLFNQFHDLLPGSGIAAIYKDAMVEYARAEAMADSVLDSSLVALARRSDTRPPRVGLQPYVVFNPSGHARDGLVPVAPLGDAADLAAFSAAGHALPSAIRDDTLWVDVPPVPATGTAVIFVGRARPRSRPRANALAALAASTDTGDVVVENQALRLEIDRRTGDIARLYDKHLRRDILQRGGPGDGLVMIHDQPKRYDAWNLETLSGARRWVDQHVSVGPVTRDALGSSVTVRRDADSVSVVQRFTLPDSAERVDVVSDIDWHQAHELLKVVFPLAFRVDTAWAEIPYGAIGRPTRPTTRRDSARFEAPMLRWVDMSNGDIGLAIVNASKYGYDAHGDTLRISLLRAPKSPDPTTDMGHHRLIYSLVPHAGDWRAPAIQDQADALNEPLRALAVAPHAAADAAGGRERGGAGRGGSPEPSSYVVLQGAGVELGALKRAEDGEDGVIRLVETYGRQATATLTFPGRAVTLQPTDLLERPDGDPIPGPDGTVRVQLRPWQIRTFRVEEGRQ